jgi:hypothetical protein
MFSPDNWYVLGDAACIFDPLYSLGSSMIAFAIESVTEIIRAKLAGEADAEKKRFAYNDFNLAFTQFNNHLVRDHDKQLGHASVMSWRIYQDYMWWFGFIVPLYVGKWHLDLDFIPIYVNSIKANQNGYSKYLYQQFNELVARDKNLGLMDCYRADQLLWDYTPLKHFDDFAENSKLEPGRCNVFAYMKYTSFYSALWYAKFLWKGYGLSGFLNPQNIRYVFRHLKNAAHGAIGEMIYKYLTRGLPKNSQVAQMRQEFTSSYQYRSELQPWIEKVAELPAQS